MSSENAASLAVLIDADNAQPSITEGLLAEVAKYGTAHVKRAYGDWTRSNLNGWKEHLLAQSIQPIRQAWQRLAGTVDLIVHSAALVNHVLPYDQLFVPNVAGTAKVIRMAMTKRIKPVT